MISQRCGGGPDGIRGCVDRSIRPCRPYYTLARASAAAVSPAFLEFFLDTTYLNDGSSVREWEQEHGHEFREGDDLRYAQGR
ncbi:MAG: hypothetical protein SGJ11_01200 [Phycisphaerae bacterium]|nr:hypothetical protein [Phycisphaerae bacterium]